MESVAHRATRRNPQAVTEGADSFRRLLGSPLTPPLRSQPLLKCLKQFVQAASQAAHANLELLMPRAGVYHGGQDANLQSGFQSQAAVPSNYLLETWSHLQLDVLASSLTACY